jgi:hypothetical protein
VAIVQHRQIKDRIEADYIPHIDLSDVQNEDDENIGLSRGMSAITISYLTDTDPATACRCIVDGFGDNGIDAIFFDESDKSLYLVQGKWNNTHTGGIDNGSILKFIQGVKDLLNSRYDKFNKKVKARKAEIDNAVTLATKVIVVITYSGSSSFSEENKRSLEDFINDVDETRELVQTAVFSQSQLYSYLLSGAQGASISDSLQLFYWGYIDSPVKSYYGQMAASDIVALHQKHGHKLFSKNIRMFLGIESSVNRSIIDTVKDSPEDFWYFNNGITALAHKITRKAMERVAIPGNSNARA